MSTTFKRKCVNPFYILLVVAGVVFTVTACAYGVMTVKQLRAADFSWSTRPGPAIVGQGFATETDTRFVQFMDQHGDRLMVIELAILGVASLAAMGTDHYWAGEE